MLNPSYFFDGYIDTGYLRFLLVHYMEKLCLILLVVVVPKRLLFSSLSFRPPNLVPFATLSASKAMHSFWALMTAFLYRSGFGQSISLPAKPISTIFVATRALPTGVSWLSYGYTHQHNSSRTFLTYSTLNTQNFKLNFELWIPRFFMYSTEYVSISGIQRYFKYLKDELSIRGSFAHFFIIN